jgi:hypothetical protein
MINEDDPDPRLPEPPDEGPDLQGTEARRPLRYSERPKSPAVAWQWFLLWLVVGLAGLWSFAFLVVWLGQYALVHAFAALGIGGFVAVAGFLLVRMYLWLNSERRPLPRRRRIRKEFDDLPFD